MSPKGGKGGSSGSSGSSSGGSSKSSSSSGSCYKCGLSVRLSNVGVGGTANRAIFVLQIILVVVIITSMVIVAMRPWLKLDQKRDRYKFLVFQLLGLFQVLALILFIVDFILRTAHATVLYGYVITYIFRSLFWRVSDILLIMLILRCLEGARNAMKTTYTKLRITNSFFVGFLALITLIGWIFTTRDIAIDLRSRSRVSTNQRGLATIDTIYASVAFVLSVGMVAFMIFIAIKKAIPARSIAILGSIVFAYFLASLLVLIFYATYFWAYEDYSYSLATASGVIGVLAQMVIVAGLAFLSMTSYKRTRQLAATKSEHIGLNAPSAPTGYPEVPKNDNQSFSTDTTYHGGYYPNNQWQPNPNQYNQYNQQSTYDPVAQPLYPTQAYNPPQQTSHVYDNRAQYGYVQPAYTQQPNTQQPQRFYGNNHAYAAVPQASG